MKRALQISTHKRMNNGEPTCILQEGSNLLLLKNKIQTDETSIVNFDKQSNE